MSAVRQLDDLLISQGRYVATTEDIRISHECPRSQQRLGPKVRRAERQIKLLHDDIAKAVNSDPPFYEFDTQPYLYQAHGIPGMPDYASNIGTRYRITLRLLRPS